MFKIKGNNQFSLFNVQWDSSKSLQSFGKDGLLLLLSTCLPAGRFNIDR